VVTRRVAFSDLFVWGFALFALCVIFLSGAYMMVTVAAVPIVNQTTTINGTSINPAEWGMSWVPKLDWVFMTFVVMLSLAMLVTGFLIPSHPIFLFIGVFELLLWLFIAPGLANAFLTMVQLTPLGGIIDYFPLTSAFFMNLPLVGLIVGAIASIFTYGKTPNPYGGH